MKTMAAPEPVWTVQEFAEVAGQPYFVLLRHDDHQIGFQFTGYRHEVDDKIAELGIRADLLEPTSESAFLARGADREIWSDEETAEALFLEQASKDWPIRSKAVSQGCG